MKKLQQKVLVQFEGYRDLLKTHLHRMSVISTKVWKESLSEGVCEGVDVCVSIRIREGQSSSVPVQTHPDLLWTLLH